MADAVLDRLEGEISDPLDGFIFEDTPTLFPGTDFHDNKLYLTIPLDRIKTVKEGKTEVERRVTDTICVASDHSYFVYDHESVGQKGFKMPPTFTQEPKSRWPTQSLLSFLKRKTQAPSGIEVFEELHATYKEYVEYTEDIYYKIVPLFIMGSYLFRIFASTGYLHFNGTAASGKSQNLKLLKAFGFNTTWVSNISTAALFRTVAGSPGIVCIDEAEGFDGERGEELRRLLNAGYLAGEPVSRVEKTSNDRFQVTQYEIYCPKVLASINPLEPVIQSRCVVIPMSPAIRRIEEFDPDDDRWGETRARLYLWAMDNAEKLAELYNLWNTGKRHALAPDIIHRQWQISQMYIVIADLIGGGKMAKELISFFNEYFVMAQKAIEQSDQLRLLLKCLPRVLATCAAIDQEWFTVKNIHGAVADYLEEDARQYYSSKKTSQHLISLGFRERRTHKGGAIVRINEADLRRAMNRRHIDPFEEDKDWFDGKKTYVSTLFGETWGAPATDTEETYDWIDEYK